MEHPQRDRLVEEIATCIERSFAGEGIAVERRAHIPDVDTGQLREVDVLVRGTLGTSRILVILESRDRTGREDVTWIEQLASKRRSVGASHVIALSTSGFTQPAIAKANREHIELRMLVELTRDELKNYTVDTCIQVPQVIHRIAPQVTLVVTALNFDGPPFSFDSQVSAVSVNVTDPARGRSLRLSLLDFVVRELRHIHDQRLLSSMTETLMWENQPRAMAEDVPFDFTTPDPHDFRVDVGAESFQLFRILGHRTTLIETNNSSVIGGFEYRRINAVETGLIGKVAILGVPCPDGRVWPFIVHNAPAPGITIVYVTGPEFMFQPNEHKNTNGSPS